MTLKSSQDDPSQTRIQMVGGHITGVAKLHDKKALKTVRGLMSGVQAS